MERVVVAFGDSITEGTEGNTPQKYIWTNLLAGKLGKNYKVFNAGVGGNSAREAMARYNKDVLSHNPDIVLIEFGGNNQDPNCPERCVSDNELKEHLETFKNGLPPECKVVVVTFPPIINEKHVYYRNYGIQNLNELLEPQRNIVRDFARKNNYLLLDLYKLLDKKRETMIQEDGVHLSWAGQAVFAEAAFNALMSLGCSETYDLALAELKKYGLEAELKLDWTLPSFQIRSSAGKITICAPNDYELLYGVYDLAERIGGYYFFEPGRDRFDIARKVTSIPDGIIAPARKPLLAKRGFVQEFPFNDNTPAILDWMAKAKLNYIQTWMKYYDDCKPEWKEMARIRGIEIESGHHNFNYWIPGRKYNKTHPEYFAERGGKRIESIDGKSELLLSEQLCTTNQGVRDEIVKNMLAYIEEHPELKRVVITPNDGFGWCECKECSKFYDVNRKGDVYSVSKHVYKADKIYHNLVKYLYDKIQAVRPDIALNFSAYINYCAPSERFTLEDNMDVNLALYWRCINHRSYDPECPINSHYADDVRAWAACKRGGTLMIYEYFMGINFYLSLPMIHFREMFDEMKWYSENGVDGIETQFHVPHWTVYGMNYVLMARACRGESYEEAMPLLYQVLFGKDAAEAESFYKQVKALVNSVGHCHIPYPYSLLNRTNLPAYQALHAQAKALAAKAPEDNFRQELLIWTEYMCRFKQLFDDYHAGKLTIPDVDSFLAWIASHSDTRVFVQSKFPFYFKALKSCLQSGKEWLHYNIDWEDEYIKIHRELLK